LLISNFDNYSQNLLFNCTLAQVENNAEDKERSFSKKLIKAFNKLIIISFCLAINKSIKSFFPLSLLLSFIIYKNKFFNLINFFNLSFNKEKIINFCN